MNKNTVFSLCSDPAIKEELTEMLVTIVSHLQIQTQRNGTEKVASKD